MALAEFRAMFSSNKSLALVKFDRMALTPNVIATDCYARTWKFLNSQCKLNVNDEKSLYGSKFT